MDIKDVALLVSIVVAIASIAGTLISTFTGLSVKNVVAAWRTEALEERNQDKDDLKKWIEDRFLPAREADSRLKRLEEDNRSHDARLRHLEQSRNHTPTRESRPQ